MPGKSDHQRFVPGDSGDRSARSHAPLFLLLFAAIYFLMAQADLNNFNVHSLTRTDALYVTVTVFTTVGFGDIVATTQVARLLVTVQMILDRSPRPRAPRVSRSSGPKRVRGAGKGDLSERGGVRDEGSSRGPVSFSRSGPDEWPRWT